MKHPVYRIAEWERVYETADSRKHKSLSWVSLPIDRQSSGYQSLIEQFADDAPAIYGAWCALVSVAAQCPNRGVLANSRGEGFTADRIARLAFMPVEPFRRLIAWAVSEDVQWLEVTADGETGADVQSITDQSPIDQPSISDQPNSALPNPNLTITQPDPTLDASASCPEPASQPSGPVDSAVEDATEVVLQFPVNGNPNKPTWGLTRAKALEYVESFPGVDVRAELRKARQWCRDNASNRKTAKGMPKFLGNWLGKAQDEATRKQRGSPSGPIPNRRGEIPVTQADLEQAFAGHD